MRNKSLAGAPDFSKHSDGASVNPNLKPVLDALVKELFGPIFANLGLGLRVKFADTGVLISTESNDFLKIWAYNTGLIYLEIDPTAVNHELALLYGKGVHRARFSVPAFEKFVKKMEGYFEEKGFLKTSVVLGDKEIVRLYKPFQVLNADGNTKLIGDIVAEIKDAIDKMGYKLWDTNEAAKTLSFWNKQVRT